MRIWIAWGWLMLGGVCMGEAKWGMVDASGTWRIAEKYDEVGKFRGDLAKSLALPEFLPGVKGAKIRKWLKAEGDEVKGGEPLAEVELTEPALPVEAPASGMLVKIGVPAGGAAIPGSVLGVVRILGAVGIFEKKQIEVECPGYGPNPGSATMVRWVKLEGDAVIQGEKIAEIRPKEAMAMIQAPGTGTLVKIEVKDGEEAKVGQAVARMGIGRVPVKVGAEWFYTDERGNRVTQDHYDEVGSMEGGMAPVRRGEKWEFVDGEGVTLGKAEQRVAGKKKDGLVAAFENKKMEFEAAHRLQGGLAAVKLNGKWGYVAYQDGGVRMAVTPRFLQARDFSEGLAAVEESDDAPVTDDTEAEQVEVEKSAMETKSELPPAWGYIIPSGKLWGGDPIKRFDKDKDGKISIKEELGSMKVNFANIDANGDGFIDADETKSCPSSEFAEAGNFLDGRAAVRGLGEGTPWVLVDSKIKVRTTGNYVGLVPLGGKRVAWRRGGGWGLMDLQEKVVELRAGLKGADGTGEAQDILAAVGPFECGLAPAKEVGGKWGYLDVDGKWAIAAKFERAGVFKCGLAAVKEVGGKWGYVKPDGSWGLEPKFSRARAFSDGLAGVSTQGEVELGPELETGGAWD